MSSTTDRVVAGENGLGAYRVDLTPEEREALSARTYRSRPRQILQWLDAPFREVAKARVFCNCSPDCVDRYVDTIFRLCRRMMYDLNMTYWGFTWENLLVWKEDWERSLASKSATARHSLQNQWYWATTTLFLMGVLPYSEHICCLFHVRPAIKWLGRERAQRIEQEFIATAKAIGYQYERQLKKNAVSALLCAMALARKTSLADITREDLEAWERQTSRSRRVARASVSCIQKVLAAMRYLDGESPRLIDRIGNGNPFSWGGTPPKMVQTFTRFLNDVAPVYRPGTLTHYRVALRRFGAWMGEHYPDVSCVSQVRRHHIEAYKKAVSEMRCGEYVNVGSEFGVADYGEPLSKSYQIRALSCLEAFFARIDLLEYPERPGRELWAPGDLPKPDEPQPRFIPDDDWHRIVDLVHHLTPEQCQNSLQPYERTKAVMTILLECGLRADELCRLDTGCLVVATDERTRAETYWLRVPVGKLRNDRIIPVSPNVVKAIDRWMTVRGPQPRHRDERTGKMVDFLFTYRGVPLTLTTLNRRIARVCELAHTSKRYTSHAFRHTLATKWRDKGMRVEAISHMLGHKDLKMTLRYVAIMPSTLREEFEEAFAAIDEEYRITSEIRVVLSPEAHLEAQQQWREFLWVDLGIGWCGLTAYLPCENRLQCQRCPNFISDRERLPLLEQQREHLIELRAIADLSEARRLELDRAIRTVEENIQMANGPDKMELAPFLVGIQPTEREATVDALAISHEASASVCPLTPYWR